MVDENIKRPPLVGWHVCDDLIHCDQKIAHCLDVQIDLAGLLLTVHSTEADTGGDTVHGGVSMLDTLGLHCASLAILALCVGDGVCRVDDV